MAKHNITGAIGEKLALQYLLEKGFKLIEKSWRYKHKEIDLIMDDNGVLVFIEVKTRTGDYFGNPEDFVTKEKQNFLIQAANYYIDFTNFDGQSRFDIVSVLHHGNQVKIDHIQEAFYP